ncbi:MAG: glycosyltransferase [Capnocytophaga sp.]|nr:glycosyltransferase [Capnocytophaga sp.]
MYGFVGRIVGDKGVNELISAFKRLNDKYVNIKLILVGEFEHKLDPLKMETLKEIKENPNIIELGYQTDVAKYYSIMNIFVSPSYREGFGLTLIEANVVGLPVIASKIIGYSEIVKDGVNGFFVEPSDEDSLFQKMEWVYLNNDS